MTWIEWLLVAIGAVVVAGGALYVWAKRAVQREPYRTFNRIPLRQKMDFLKAVVTDRRIPLWVKAIPFVIVVYLAMPIDLIPDFIPVLGYLDDVAIVLLAVAAIVKFTPAEVMTDLLRRTWNDKPPV